MAHTHFILHGYVQLLETGALTDSVVVDILATSEAEAIKRAKSLVKKPHWRISNIVEHDPYIEDAHLRCSVHAAWDAQAAQRSEPTYLPMNGKS